jgi:hypothetical protein
MLCQMINFTSDGRVNMRTYIHAEQAEEKRPAINPIIMAEAMQRHDLPYELHIFQEGQHGMSVGNNAPGKSLDDSPYPSVDMWVPLCENWINSLFH